MQNFDASTILNDAYAAICTESDAAREIPGYGAWVPSNEINEYDAADAVTRAACDAGDTTRGLLEICLEYLGDDPIWQELEEAATRAFMKFAEELDLEAARILEEDELEA